MVHAKFHNHKTISSVGKAFLRFLPYMGVVAILVTRPGPFIYTLFPLPRRFHIKFVFDWQSGSREKDL